VTQVPPGPNPTGPQPPDEQDLDAAQQSLSDALRVSFTLLKGLMILLLVVYIFSGVFRVEENEIGVRYRFGERVDTHQRGWHLGWPFPIDQVVVVPLNQQTVRLNESFWYNNPEDLAPEQLASKQLNPLEDSFLITGDGNVVHVQFEIKYVIKPSAVEDYLRNVGSLERANQLVQTAAERGMIHSVATANIEDIIIKGSFDRDDIAFRMQQVLDEVESGITVQDVLIDNNNQSMPTQVRQAYTGVTQAQADKVRTIQEARRAFDETLGQTAGGAHPELLTMVRAYEAALSNEQDELAAALRAELDRSIRDLRLPEPALMSRVRAYLSAATAAAASDDESSRQAAAQASQVLEQSLDNPPEDRSFGAPITGEIAATISRSKANRSDIATQARLDYERYASALQAYEKTPRVLANDRLQATREAVMSGLVQTIIGPIQRIDTNGDPEVQEEIAEAELRRRQEEARQQEEAGN